MMGAIFHGPFGFVLLSLVSKSPNVDHASLTGGNESHVIFWERYILDSVAVAFQGVQGIVVNGVEDEDIGILVRNDKLAAMSVLYEPASGEIDIIEMAEGLVDQCEDLEPGFEGDSDEDPVWV